MADKIVSQDPTKPGVLKVNGPTLTSSGTVPLVGLDTTGAVNGNVIVLTAGTWAPGAVASSDTASNLGAGSQVFKSKVAADFQFRSLVAGSNVTIVQNANDLTISSSVLGSIAILVDQKAQNTPGGTFTTGAWRTRDINTEVADPDGLVTIAANQMTLIAGTYRVYARAPANGVNRHTCRIQNITDATTLATGSSQYTNSSPSINVDTVLWGRFTIAVAKVLELQHICETTSAANVGFGFESNFQVETYSQVIFWKE